MNVRPAKTYLIILFAAASIVIGMMGGVNFLVDPYLMNGAYLKSGFNAVKPALARKTFLHVAWRLHSVRVDTLVFGTSRTEIGIDPSSRGFQNRPTYNAAIGGASVYASWRYFQHALIFHKPKRLLIGLDFFAFNESSQGNHVPEDILLRGEPSLIERARLGLIAFKTYISLDTLLDSLMTVRSQDWHKGGLKNIHGLMAPPHSSRTLYANFRNNISAFMEGIWFPGRAREFVLRPPAHIGPVASSEEGPGTHPTNAFGYLDAILAAAARENIEVVMFISPHHAYLLEALHAAGLWDKYETWKRHLTKVAAKWHGATLWDFSGYNRFTTEPVPGPSDNNTKKMRWHIEASHFSPELGALVTSKIFNVFDPGQDLRDFGAELKPNTIHAHLQSVRASREKYLAQFGGRVQEILTAAHRANRYAAPNPSKVDTPTN